MLKQLLDLGQKQKEKLTEKEKKVIALSSSHTFYQLQQALDRFLDEADLDKVNMLLDAIKQRKEMCKLLMDCREQLLEFFHIFVINLDHKIPLGDKEYIAEHSTYLDLLLDCGFVTSENDARDLQARIQGLDNYSSGSKPDSNNSNHSSDDTSNSETNST